MLLCVSSLFLCRIGNDVLKQRFQFASMLARSRVDDDGSLWSGSLDLAHAEPMPFQSSADLRCAKVDVQPVAFDRLHGLNLYVGAAG